MAMTIAKIVALAALTSSHVVASAPSQPHLPHYMNPGCINLRIPVTATNNPAIGLNKVFDIVHPDDNTNATASAVDLQTINAPTLPERVVQNITVSGTYSIAAHLCIPKNGSKKDHLQIASHGAIYDSRYWDLREDPSQYSWVHNMMEAGYSVLTYDRIGTGESDHPDAYTVVQTPLQSVILMEITKIAKAGELLKYVVAGVSNTDATFKKFIHVGHSQGSYITLGFLAGYGEMSDGAVLSGVLPTMLRTGPPFTSLDVQYAAEANPTLFGNFGSGYVVPTIGGVQTGFLSIRRNYTVGLGGFTPALKEYGDSIKQPMAITEIISSAVMGVLPAPSFSGPMQFVLGEFDNLNCDGDCRGAEQPALLKELFPNATSTDVYLQPGTGHGLPFHRGANIGFQKTINWLGQNGL